MNVKVSAIFSQATQLLLQNRILLILALLSAAAGTTLSFGAGSPASATYTPGSTPTSTLLTGSSTALSVFSCLTLLIVFVLGIFVRPALDAGLVAAVEQSKSKRPPTLREAWRLGLAYLWRVLGLELLGGLIAGLFALVAFLILFCVLAVLFSSVFIGLNTTLNNPSSPASTVDPMTTLLPGFIVLGVMLIVFLPIWIALSGIVELAKRAIVLHNTTIGQGWSFAWKIVRGSGGRVASVVLAVWLVTFVLLIPSLLMTFFVMGDPPITTSVFGADLPLPLVILIGILDFIVSVLCSTVAIGWGSTVWTLFYQALVPAAPTYANTAIYNQPQPNNNPYNQQPNNQTQGGYGAYPPANQPQNYNQPQQGGYPQYDQPPGGFSVPGQYPNAPQQGSETTPLEYPPRPEQSGRIEHDQPTSETHENTSNSEGSNNERQP